MNLTDQQIQDSIDVWKRDFGETLSPEIAELEAGRLLEFFTEMAESLTVPNRSEELDHSNGLKAAWKETMRRRR